jgi:SAM-dependent methyltransferase
VPKPLRGAVPSPNIWHHTETYELENRSVDPDRVIESAMGEILASQGRPGGWSGRDVLDLGCGTGFHLPRWAADARRVHGVEPHPGLAALAARRTAGLANVSVAVGTAQRLPLPPASVEVMHARWAYFFGPGCEPGLRELDRVMRRGGTGFVVDNDTSRSTFGSWFRRGHPGVHAVEVERFWSLHGWQRRPLDVEWRFTTRQELEAVVRIELDERVATEVLAEHTGTRVDYAVNLWWRRF